jgi:hypothetical protein
LSAGHKAAKEKQMVKKIWWRPAFMAVVVGLALSSAGCASLLEWMSNASYQGVETDQSKQFLDGANDILTQNPEGVAATQFWVLFQRKFPGTTLSRNSENGVEFTYQERKYILWVSNVPKQVGKNNYFYYVAATSCKDMTPPAKE